MFTQLEKAIEQKQFDLAQTIIQQLNEEKVDQLWLEYYKTLIVEQQDNLVEAEKKYRQIIKDSIYPDPKLIKLIRDGIERIIQIKEDKKEAQKEVFTQQEDSQNLAILVLEPVSVEHKKELAPHFAQIMEIDRYTATLQIPTRSWRLSRTGSLGELNYYQSELSKRGIPCFCHPVEVVNKIVVEQVKYINYQNSENTVICENPQGEEEKIDLDWQKITQCVRGIIPLFEMTVNVDVNFKIEKKQSTLDYIEFYDLHATSSNTIFRFCDRSYQYDQDTHTQNLGSTTKEKWQYLVKLFEEKIPNHQLYSDFGIFGEEAMQFPQMLKEIESHIHLFRREDSLWDEAFQLYSGLVFQQRLTQSSDEEQN